METNYRFYKRRAAEEASRAATAVTPAARARHKELAVQFVKRAEEELEVSLETSGT